MSKIQDVVMPASDKSIRDIKKGGKKTPAARPPRRGRRPPGDDKGFSKFAMWFIAVFCLLFLFFAVSVILSGAKVKITPRQEMVTLSGLHSAFRNLENADEGVLRFEIMTIEREEKAEVPATGEEFVEERASGRIVIFNDFNSRSQRLIKNTRFETPEGLIYRIRDSVVVPGQTTDQNGNTVPGSIEATVFADQPGEEYNIGLSDFTIPGFQGDPRFDKFFARSETEMTGGFRGNKNIASESDLNAARENLRAVLKQNILTEAHSVKPEGFLLLDESYDIVFEEETESRGDRVVLTERAVFYGYIYEEGNLAGFLADIFVEGYEGGSVEVVEEDRILVILAEDNPGETDQLSIELSGEAKIVWKYDEDKLKADLVGVQKSDIDRVFERYPSIREAEVTVRPFWKRAILTNPDKIKIERLLD